MQLVTLMLCDHAQVREGLLFVSSGGVSHLRRDEFPAPAGIMAALQVSVPAGSSADADIAIRLHGPNGDELMNLDAHLGTNGPAAAAPVVVPMIIDLRPLELPGAGTYTLTARHNRQTLTVEFAADAQEQVPAQVTSVSGMDGGYL